MITEEAIPPSDEPTTIISKGEIYSHYIQPISITNDEMMVKLSLTEAVPKNKSFFFHEVGKEESLAQVMIRKGKKSVEDEIDIDEIEDKSLFSIAAYSKDDRKQPLSNIVQMSVPGM